VVLELGYFRRQVYYQVSLNNIGWVPKAPKPADRLKALRLPRLVTGTGAREVLVCGQKPLDAQHELTADDLNWWAWQTCEHYRQQGSTVRYRPHPHDHEFRKNVPAWTKHVLVSDGLVCPMSEDMARACTVVTLNSTAGLEALYHGRHVVCHPTAFYAERSGADPVGHPEFLHRVAYAQWTLQEIAEGLCHRVLLEEVDREQT